MAKTPKQRAKPTNEMAEASSSKKSKKLESRSSNVSDEIVEEKGTAKTSRLRAKPTNEMAESSPSKKTKKLESRSSSGSDEIMEEKVSKPVKNQVTPDSKISNKSEDSFVGEPFSHSEAVKKWPQRYEEKKYEDQLLALRHYTKAKVDGVIYKIYDDVYVQAEDDKPNYIAKIVEFFESTDRKPYFTAQWYYRHVDTVIQERVFQELEHLFDGKRLFYSDVRDENPLDCLVSKFKIIQIDARINSSDVPRSDFYCDMSYSLTCSTMANLPIDSRRKVRDSSSTVLSEKSCSEPLTEKKGIFDESTSVPKTEKLKMKLLDLYAGCGAMSTGLCLGAAISGVDLLTRWAVDLNEHACVSLRFNHPETEVRNESAEDFLSLLKEWSELCRKFVLPGDQDSVMQCTEPNSEEDGNVDDSATQCIEPDSGEFEVEKLIDICFGDPNKSDERGLYFKVHWKGYNKSYDSWEPIGNLSECDESIKEFVTKGYKANFLPLPGDVDVICGGPPCQGVSGFNRFRNTDNPLQDPRNSQLIVFMDIVEYLKPKYVLMENVSDLLKFVGGYLGRYTMGRLVAMKYQTRLGLMAAGGYGLPQYRLRAFFWGAYRTEKLPQFPLPTHEVLGRGSAPRNFEGNVVAYDRDHPYKLDAAVQLRDAISDLPEVTNDEIRDEMPYGKAAKTEFQKQIRLPKNGSRAMLYDHLPLKLNNDDYLRVCRIPMDKGANFRMLPGIVVDETNTVQLDPTVERECLPSGNFLVPDYALTFVKGKSTKPFGRLWWDEIVPTVVTRAEPHNQRILHPLQNRVLSVRENARIQGFPDYYKLSGPVKERYTQVGNAVAVPVARALGYALGLACQGISGDEALFSLPPKFPNCLFQHEDANV